MQPQIPAADIAAAFDVIGRVDLSRRRRLQADLLRQKLGELAELASHCGWQGAAMARGGQALVEHDGALLHAEHGHFRTAGQSPAHVLVSTLDRFAIRPRVIVDLHAGAGEVAILLAQRFPRCRVIATEASRERLEAFDANLVLQGRPLENLEIAPIALDGDPESVLRAMAASGEVGRVDLLRCQATTANPALAALVRALDGRITLARVTLSGPASQHAELLAALQAAGLVMLEKRSQAIEEPRAWLQDHLGRGPIPCWFVARKRLARDGRPRWPILGLLADVRRDPVQAKAWLYGMLDGLQKRLDPTQQRFEFEKLYTLKPDPWRYRSSAYETLKYQRTLQAALRLRPRAETALEIACSIGVFTRMLARTFPRVVAVDVADEALRLARRQVARIGHVSYVRSDIRRLDLGRRHDLIFCAEMLYYLSEDAAPDVLRTIDHNLAPGGVLVTVMPHAFGPGLPDPFSGWNGYLTRGGLRLISEEDFDDPGRPYFIRAYERGEATE